MAKPSNPQIGGWYDGQQWDGSKYGPKGQVIVGASGGSSSGGNAYDANYGKISGEVNKWADELISQAKGDFDQVSKWIEESYKTARGNNQTDQAEFLKSVANSMEEKVGRIAFDYKTGTYRASQDEKIATDRTVQGRDMALQRLDQDEQVWRQTFGRETAQERAQQDASLNQRGILSAPRDQATGLGGQEVGYKEAEINDRLNAFDKELGRTREDIGLASGNQLADIRLGGARAQEDLTTGARRSAIDSDLERTQSSEEAKRMLEQRKNAAEQQRRSALNQAKTYADYISRPA